MSMRLQGAEADVVMRLGRPSSRPIAMPTGRVAVTPLISTAPSCLFLNVCYPAFVADVYRRDPALASRSAREQQAVIAATGFGDADFYSHHLGCAGWLTDDLIVNAPTLLAAWARDSARSSMGSADRSTAAGFMVGPVAGPAAGNLSSSSAMTGLDVVVAEVRKRRPDVLYLQDLALATDAFVAAVRPHIGLLVGQIASPMPDIDPHHFDLIFSSLPHFVAGLRMQGIAAYYQPLAFDARILQRLPDGGRDIPLSFVGGLSPAHGKGLRFLEHVARHTPLQAWGYGADTLAVDSPLRPCHRGEAWGLDMFGLLARSRITVNRHIDVARNYANNMRLFEATGCGALLVTDYKDNLAELFDIGREVVAYRSPEECVALVNYYMAHPDEAQAIAQAGQLRTLRDYSYADNMAETAVILQRHLRRRLASPLPMPAQVSSHYQPLPDGPIDAQLLNAWQSPQLPQRQWALVSDALGRLHRGEPTVEFKVLQQALVPYVRRGSSVLEVGCSSGYYGEVLQVLLPRRLNYIGVDNSVAMIEFARQQYPELHFEVADGAALPFADRSIDAVVSGCVLLHVPAWQAQVAEAVRVSNDLVVLHRTPVCRLRPTQRYQKLAYGVPTVELRFNEDELVGEVMAQGCSIDAVLQYQGDEAKDEFEVTYVFRRR